MPYGTIKVDNITFTNAGSDQTITVSGLFSSTSGNLTVTGTVSGNTIQGQTISGVTVTGTTANFTSGNFTNISGGTHTITSGVFAAGSAAAPSISFVSDPNTGIYSPGADQVAISTNGTGRLFVDASGNVGVGTNDTANAFVTLTKQDVSLRLNPATGAASITAVQTGVAFRDLTIGSNETIFQTASLERVRLDSSGRLGLGTSSPSDALHLASGNFRLTNGSAFTSSNATIASIRSFAGSANQFETTKISFETDAFVNRGEIVFSTGDDSNTCTEKVRIDYLGRLGIGTAIPGAKLDVWPASSEAAFRGNSGESVQVPAFELRGYNTNATNGGLDIRTNLNGTFTDRVRITNDGLVGIGTSSPALKLSVDGDVWLGNGAGVEVGRLFNDSGVLHLRGSSNVTGLALGTNDSEKVRITTAGNVGIGTTSPGAKLNVSDTNALIAAFGRTGATGAQIALNDSASSAGIGCSSGALTFGANGYDTERARIDSSGRLGLGTSSPATNLDIRGTNSAQLRIGSTSGDLGNNTEIGTLEFFNSDANQNAIAAYVRATRGGGFGSGGYLTFGVSASGSSASAATEALRIDESGNVGIGTTAPQGKLIVSNGGANGIEFFPDTDSGANSTINSFNRSSSTFSALSINAAQHIFLTSSSERARIDSSGRLLVGTSSTSSEAKLLVQGGSTGSGAALHLQRNATTASAGSTIGYLRFANSADNAGATIVAEGDGTWTAGTSHPTRLVFSTTADGESSPTERMRITKDGKFAFGGQGAPYAATTCDSYGNTSDYFTHVFRQDNASGYGIGVGVDGIGLIYFYPNKDLSGAPVGTITQNGSSTAYNTSSDYRLKENIAPLTGATDRLNQLQVHRFNFIANPGKTVDGFIAHEAQAVVPECVTGTKDEVDADGNPVYQGIDQSKLVPLLTAALQEALTEIESLKARVTALEP